MKKLPSSERNLLPHCSSGLFGFKSLKTETFKRHSNGQSIVWTTPISDCVFDLSQCIDRTHNIPSIYVTHVYRLQDLVQNFRTLELKQETGECFVFLVRNFPVVNERDAEHRLSRLRITFEGSLHKHQRQTLILTTVHKYKYNNIRECHCAAFCNTKRNLISSGA